jgi:hypothetical protein
MNSIPAAVRTPAIEDTVLRCGSTSLFSNLRTVKVVMPALAASFGRGQPNAARAALHCWGVSNLTMPGVRSHSCNVVQYLTLGPRLTVICHSDSASLAVFLPNDSVGRLTESLRWGPRVAAVRRRVWLRSDSSSKAEADQGPGWCDRRFERGRRRAKLGGPRH